MKYFEFGKEHPELMVMLHGGGVCYRGALPVAEEMAKVFHVVLADDRLTVTTTIADGMPTMDYADIKNPVLQNIYLFFLTGFAYRLIGKAGPVRRKIVCRMMKRSEDSFDRIVYKDATWRSWVNQDRCMIGRHRNFELFKRTDMYIWHDIQSSAEKKLAGEHPEQFSQEVQAAHRKSMEKEKL